MPKEKMLSLSGTKTLLSDLKKLFATKDVCTTSTKGLMDPAILSKLNGIATGANKYVHPTTAGNKHIPSGGAKGNFLVWSASGTAVWDDDNAVQLTKENLDTLLTPGKYFGAGSNTVLGKPKGIDYFGLEVYKIASGYIAQRLHGSDNIYYHRYYNNIEKKFTTDWIDGYDSIHKPTVDEIGAAAKTHNHGVVSSTANGFMPKLDGNTSHYMCGDGTWREAPKSSVNKSEIVNMIYPIGSLYMSTSAANPSTLFGGTWEAFGQGRTIIGKTDDGMFSELESVGGAESRSISVAAHTHTIAHTHTVASHSHTISHTHGIGAHSHTIAHTHSIPSHSHTCGSTAISVAQSASHSHAFHMPPNRYGALGVTSAGFGGTSYNGYANIQYSEQGSIGINSQGSNNGHNHSISGTGLTTGGSSATNSGGTSLTTGGSSVANSGASSPKTGDPSATNSGSAGAQNISINITQPYIVVNIWKRTA